MQLSCFICMEKLRYKDPVNYGFDLERFAQYDLEEHLRTHTIDEIISGMARMHWSLGLGTFEREYGIKKMRKRK